MIDSFDKLPLGLYLELRAIPKDIDETDRTVAVIAILTGQTERDVLNAPIADFREWAARAAFLDQEPPTFRRRVADAYHLGGFELVPTTDLRKVTTAQYIDFQGFAPEGEARLPELLSVFLVPRGHKYGDGYDPVDVQQAIRDGMSVTDVLTLAAFFLTSYAKLIRASRSFLARLARTEKDKAKRERIRTRLQTLETLLETLRLAGDGSPTWTPSPRPADAPGMTSGA